MSIPTLPSTFSSPRRLTSFRKIEPHDLVLSKYVAGRDKDRAFARVALAHRLVLAGTLLDRLDEMPVDAATKARLRVLIEHDAAGATILP